jgi:hypothetical protein
MRITSSLTSALALTVVVAIPDRADACDPDPCPDSGVLDGLMPVNAAFIPSDGVLVLRASGQGDGDAWTDTVSLAVELDGQPVDGALEPVPGIGSALVWRSAAALVPGVYTATGTVDNPDDLDYCGDDLDLNFEFTVDAAPSTVLMPPEVTAAEVLEVHPGRELGDLVCCEGVMPLLNFNDCGGSSPPDYPPGSCGVINGTGVLTVTLDIAPKLPIATVGLLAYTVVSDGTDVASSLSPQLQLTAVAPLCSQVRVTNLATGETAITAESCHGEAQAGMLGPQTLDPTAELTCDGQLQTCETDVSGNAWDLTQCTPWPPEGETSTPTEGGSGATESASDTAGDSTGQGGPNENGNEEGFLCALDPAGDRRGALGLLALLALARRRRAR